MPTRQLAPFTFQDLSDSLIWPKLLRAGPLALRPARIGLGILLVVGLFIFGALFDRLDTDSRDNALVSSITQAGLSAASAALTDAPEPGQRFGRELYETYVAIPGALLRNHTLAALVVLPLMFAWLALLWGAIARSAATEFAQGVHLSWPQMLAFALRRAVALILALALPLLVAWAIILALAIGGWALFSLPIVNVLGGLLWLFFLIFGVLAAIIILLFTFAGPMLVPSVACEGTDAIDAFQHAYAFAFARPVRLILYSAVLILQGVVLLGIVGSVIWLGIHIAQSAAMSWSGPRGTDVLSVLPGNHGSRTDPTFAHHGSNGPAAAIASFWTILAILIPAGVFVSYLASASTVLYLTMRRLVDGQDTSEIWFPGILPGTQAPVAAATTPPPKSAASSVSDTGPADET